MDSLARLQVSEERSWRHFGQDTLGTRNELLGVAERLGTERCLLVNPQAPRRVARQAAYARPARTCSVGRKSGRTPMLPPP